MIVNTWPQSALLGDSFQKYMFRTFFFLSRFFSWNIWKTPHCLLEVLNEEQNITSFSSLQVSFPVNPTTKRLRGTKQKVGGIDNKSMTGETPIKTGRLYSNDRNCYNSRWSLVYEGLEHLFLFLSCVSSFLSTLSVSLSGPQKLQNSSYKIRLCYKILTRNMDPERI